MVQLPSVQKDWHPSVEIDVRLQLIKKLVQSLFPNAIIGLPGNDPRMINLTSFARKVEGDFFEMANSSAEYYYLLAQKIHQILRDLAERQRKRREEQQAEEEVIYR